ncbi:MAG: GH3 auxin-responsive promoter family protein [Bacteroidetes bacterium]|nr:GH3 auxin-responsive promoter family protein [Bacteroidota bacterium]
MHFINEIAKFYFSTRVPAIEYFLSRPAETQQQTLAHLLHRARHTVYGREYGFADIENYRQFAAQVPIHDYDGLKPFFQRMMQGEADILWPGRIQWFAKSSGTTNDVSKFIPLSREGLHQSHIKTGKDFLSIYLKNNPSSRFFTGKGIVMGGAGNTNAEYPGIFIGDVSAILMKNLDTWIQYFREPSLDVALMAKWEEKLDRIASVTMQQNVTNISGVPSWTLLLLKKVLEKTGKDQISDVWPHLELYCHGGVGFAPYRKQFEEIIGRQVFYQNVYNASEGFFAWQDTLDSDDMLLHLDNGVFYEFMPFDGNLKTRDVVNIEDVRPGVNYAMLISTNSGLWRYQIGDTIEFTSIQPHRIKITGRTKQYINVWGEEVTVNNTDNAISGCCAEMDAKLAEYTVAPIYTDSCSAGRHEWAIEFSRPPADIDLFAKALDQKLQSINSDYAAKRSGSLILQALTLVPLAPGTFYRWMDRRNRLGSQCKIPRLSNERKMIDELKDISRMIC